MSAPESPRTRPEADRADTPPAGATPPRSRLSHPLHGRGELVLAAVLAGLAGLLVYGNLTMNVIGDGGLLGPQGATWLVALVAAVLTLLFVRAASAKTEEQRAVEHAALADTNWVALATALGGLVAFTALLEVVGWLLMATFLFTCVALAMGNRHLLRNLTVGFIMASVLQILFSGLLGLALPPGLLGSL